MSSKYHCNLGNVITKFFVLLSIATSGLCQEYSHGNSNTKDLIDIVSEKHIETARCRLFCFKELLAPNLSYFNLDMVLDRCKNDSISCYHCYDMCEKIINDKTDGNTLCDYKNHMCFGGCRTACKYHLLSNKKYYQPKMSTDNEKYGIEGVVKDCVLYWKFHSKKSASKLTLFQIYGKGLSNTWFNLGQTTQSFLELRPSMLEKFKTIVVLSVDQDRSAKLEYILEENSAVGKCYTPYSSKANYSRDFVNAKPLFKESLVNVEKSGDNASLIVVVILVLSIFLLLAASLCVFVCRFKGEWKCKWRPSYTKSTATLSTVADNDYEEIDVVQTEQTRYIPEPLRDHRDMGNELTVALPPTKRSVHSDWCPDQTCNSRVRTSDQEEESGHKFVVSSRDQFVDTVSWLRTINSEMKFKSFSDNGLTSSANTSVYPTNYFHAQMSPHQ